MGTVTESIFSNREVVIPLADVQHIEKHYEFKDWPDGTKKGDLKHLMVITKHTKWNYEEGDWETAICIPARTSEEFLKAWCAYRHELELDTLVEE
jgi:hypothetical protein